ncbi:hypothetical protein [Streptomyces sp. CB01373]|uniref:hypothetical protein n=1 Tax=Streptomyces sp. CB01373 TaxID=2020325 RepID=UPI000C276871|nr:hypothetical protein [Streptomyces sp. CB01373]PJM95154.1 hypothetical protein CG719_14725 [Streptomyces sp. CB01373]
MAITDDLRKTLSDPTPLYFAAGTADLALQQAKKVPALVDQLRADAPARIDAVRNTDPKAVQARATARAKEAGVRVRETQENLQTRVNGFLNYLDSDLKKLSTNLDADLKRLGESAQDLALRGVGVAAEYAVKARETYEKVAEHGEQAVRTWRGQAADGIEDIAEEVEELAVAVEPEPKAEPVVVKEDGPAENGATPITAKKNHGKGKGPAMRRTPPTAKRATPPTP